MEELNQLLEEANKIYWENFDGETYFERAIFLSWYCSVGDCTFCFMSTQKNQIKNPKLAKRQIYSLFAEAILCKNFNWPIGFLSGGYGVYNYNQVVELTRQISGITEQKQWMNIGVLPKSAIEKLKPYIEGVTGSVETVNKKLHKQVCPSKPIEPIISMYESAKELDVQRSMTLIVGLGETLEDFPKLVEFINENKIDKIVVYALNPIKGTVFRKGPEPEYYLEWLARIRIAFPKLYIVAGTWVGRLEYLSEILKAGPNAITKLPVWKVFGTKYAGIMKYEMQKANRKFLSEFINLPDVDWGKEVNKLEFSDDEKIIILNKVNEYIDRIKENK